MSSADTSRPAVVYDCMVFLQGAARPEGPAAACLDLTQNGRVTLYLSPYLLMEIRDVLTRPKIRRKYPVLTPEYVDRFLENLLGSAVFVADVPRIFHYRRDSKDEPYLNLALAANAQFIVSRDNDLLDLMDENLPEGRAFRARFPTLTIVNPVDFLNRLVLPAG